MRQIAKTFRELDIWKLAVLIAKQTYALTQQLPNEERYGLVAQMRRAAISPRTTGSPVCEHGEECASTAKRIAGSHGCEAVVRGSLSANIAEGFRRQSPKEFRQFLRISLSSSAELESYCELCRELFDGRLLQLEELLTQLDRFDRMTNTMHTKLRPPSHPVTQSPSHTL